MSATAPNVGVSAPSTTPSSPPTWPDAVSLPAAPIPSSIAATAWPRPALWATVISLFAALSLLAWNVYASSRWATRPTTLERGTLKESRLDLNRADRVQLLQLQGVGETLAARIEAYRDEHHGFRSVDELRRVHGVGPALLDKLRPHVCVVPFEADDESDDADDEPHPPAPPTSVPVRKPAADKPTTSKKVSGLNGPIDINRATAEELQRLPGIGPTLSQRIVEKREQTPFKSVNELRQVKGIGAKTLENLRPFVMVADAEDKKD